MKPQWDKNNFFGQKELITSIESHTGGEPLRIFTDGLPDLPGDTILQKRRYLNENLDQLRKALIWEPRGHFNMYGCIVTEAVSPAGDFGVIFLHNEGYSTMCGHAIIALVTVLVETGAVEAQSPLTAVNLDTPAGLVRAEAHVNSLGKVESVSFLNVPSFVFCRDLRINTRSFGNLTVDISFGGAFYAFLEAEQIGLSLHCDNISQFMKAGREIKEAVNRTVKIEHPFEEDLGFLYGSIFTSPPQDPQNYSRNICIFADSEVDRSPTGTGVSARLALHFAKGDIAVNQPVVIESILGKASAFTGEVTQITEAGSFAAVVPKITGKAFISGRNQFYLDPQDDLGKGFLV